MNRSIVWSLGLAVMLLTSTIAGVLPVNVKAQQNVTITTSADRFYGPSLVKVTINAPNDNANDNARDHPSIEIVVKDDNNNEVDSKSFTLEETGDNTGTFELFIAAHTNATASNPSSGATTVRIYQGAVADHDDTSSTDRVGGIDVDLDKGYKIIIRHPTSGVEKTITYDSTSVTFNTNRSTAGNSTIIKLIINDQDANLDPTGIDKFNATGIITSSGATLTLGSNTNFTETGSNTGIFELEVTVNDAVPNIAVTTFPNSVTFILTEHDVYHQSSDTYPDGSSMPPTLGTPPFTIPDSTTSIISETVQLMNSDGQIELTKDLTVGNGFAIKITDPDRNVRTDAIDEFTGDVKINGQTLSVKFKETGDNTGVFVADLSNNRIPIVIDTVTSIVVDTTNNRIKVSASVIAAEPDIVITYSDPNEDPSGAKDFSITRNIQHESATLSTETSTVSLTGKVTIVIDDMDLDTDSTIINSHTVNNPNVFRDIANGLGELKISVPGKTVTSVPNIVFTETEAGSGIFRGEFNVNQLQLASGQTLEDGDKIKVEYTDNTEDPSVTRSVDISVSVAAVDVELDRSSYPPSHKTAEHDDNTSGSPVNNNLIIHVLITDPSENSSPTSEDSIPLTASNFELELLGPTDFTIYPGQNQITSSAPIKNAAGTQFAPIGDTNADETGVDTGIFKVDITLPTTIGTTVINDDYQIKVTYTSASGDDASATASIVSHTATISTDATVYNLGDNIVLTINEPDWNTDSEEKDTVPTNINAIFIDAKKDGTIADISSVVSLEPDNIEETEANSGIFRITIESINEKLAERGGRIVFEYVDATTDGAAGEETIKHTVNIVSGIPEIIFDKEVYTPFEEVCITIIDAGANVDKDTKDKLPRVVVEVGKHKDTLTNTFEETEANSGIFMFRGDECISLDAELWDDSNPNTSTSDGELPAARDRAIRVTYETATGDIELTKSALIIFNDGSISFDKTSYKIGERARITVVDPDLNKDPDIDDTVSVDVFSTTDRAGISVTLRETGKKTGIFTGEVILSTDTSSGTRLQVSENDIITARYVDRTLPDPADYNEDTNPTESVDVRRLDATATIGVLLLPTERAPASEPRIVDELGNPIAQVQAGNQVLISSTVTNNQAKSQNYVHIFKVVDEDGNVILLSFTSGTLNSKESRTNAVSWTPDEAGRYTIEIFVWESFANPVALSPKITSTIEVM